MADSTSNLKARLEIVNGSGMGSEAWLKISGPLIQSLCNQDFRTRPDEYIAAYTAVHDIVTPTNNNIRKLAEDVWSRLINLLREYVSFVAEHMEKGKKGNPSNMDLQQYKARYDRTEKLAEHILFHIIDKLIRRDEDEVPSYGPRRQGLPEILPRPDIVFRQVWTEAFNAAK